MQVEGMAPAAKTKDAVESLRDIVQDLLVPELKAIKMEQESLRREMGARFEGIQTELSSIRTEMRLRDEKQTVALHALSDKMNTIMDIRERLAVLEDRDRRPAA